MAKMTKKENLATLRDIVNDATLYWLDKDVAEDMFAFIDHEIEQLSKRKSSVNSKAKAEADARAERVFAALAEMTEPVTLTELCKLTSDEEVAGYTPQRMSALMKKLGERVNKEMVKGRAYFSIA